MSGSLPTTKGFSATSIESVSRTVVSRNANGKRKVSKLTGQRWQFTGTYAPMSDGQWRPIDAFLNSQYGRFGTFTVTNPVYNTPRGTIAGTPVTNSTYSAGDTTVYINGLTAGTTLLAGDILKFANHTKVYMITADVTAGTVDKLLLEGGVAGVGPYLLLEGGVDGVGPYLLLESSGQIGVTIFPALVAAVSDNEAVTVTNVPFTVALTNDVQKFNTARNGFHSFELDVEEVY